ncbi:hypothetical protein HHK36_026534 [Tetracentron sinense]|uniref:Gamma-tubulin complex component n=1 Tax=Tetracentron sinense TaxID=13715 RepID=A0A835D4P9_TETSI|nr:hypothetical protein HHK36_026534 [Tetracentron sinense]
MLHELLLALLGYTGDLIIDEKEQQKSLGVCLSHDAPISGERTFKLAPDLSFIESSERDVIERLISLGFYYRELDRFATKAIANCIVEILSVSRFAVLHVEQKLLSNPVPILATVTQGLNKGRFIERLISLGFYYRELDRFAKKSQDLSWIRSTNEAPLSRTSELLKGKTKNASAYHRAIANGIVKILSVYKSAVLHVEQKLLSNPVPILATVTQGLNKFFVLLSPLYELIVEIERDDIRGGQLLNLLHKRRHCGVPELQACIKRSICLCSDLTIGWEFFCLFSKLRLLWHGHQVMYHQLASWMVHGILQDQDEEFFIRRQEDREIENESSHPDMFEKLAHKIPDEASLTDWHLGFHIFLDMLPEYIHMRVAESILFAGKAIRVLRNPSMTFGIQYGVYHQQIPRGSHRAQGSIGQYAFHKESSMDAKLIREELLSQSEADKIDAMLQELKESSEFHKRSFEYAVDSVHAIAASHLRQLVVVRADLNGHLKALKDYFLLAKGDFFQYCLEESRQLKRLPPLQSTAEADLLIPFQLLLVLLSCLLTLISQSFLDIGSVSRILDSIMKLCLQFCWNIENHESSPNTHELENITETQPPNHPHIVSYDPFQEFNKKSNSLYTIRRSSRLAGSQRAPFLRLFLLHLNFNSFFEVILYLGFFLMLLISAFSSVQLMSYYFDQQETARGVLNVVR